jgi:hypothetical protein
MGPIALALGDEFKKFLGAEGVGGGIAANFVEGEEGMVDVEGGVFETFGDDGSGELLPAENEAETGFALVGQNVGRIEEQQDVAEKIETVGMEIGFAIAGFGESVFEKLNGFGGEIEIADVGAVDGEAGGGFDERIGELVAREIAGVAGLGGQFTELAAERAHFNGEDGAHDQFFLLVEDFAESGIAADEVGIDAFEFEGARRVDEDAIGEIEVVVAGGAGDGPIERQIFVTLEDFFDDDVGFVGAGGLPFGAEAFLEALKIGKGIAEAVNVVDAEANDGAARD